MRQILVDHARRRQAGKRAGLKVSDLLALDAALGELERFDTRKCQAIELRYFGGLDMSEIAETDSLPATPRRTETR